MSTQAQAPSALQLGTTGVVEAGIISINKYVYSGGFRGRGAADPIDLTNFCINVKSNPRMHQNPFSGKNSIFSGEGAQPLPRPFPRPSAPIIKFWIRHCTYTSLDSMLQLCYYLILFNVRQSYCARSWYRLSVCPSVCLSVRHTWYCVETAQPIVKLFSLPVSPMILVFWGPNFFLEFQWEHSNGGVKCKGVGKSCNFRPISRYSS